MAQAKVETKTPAKKIVPAAVKKAAAVKKPAASKAAASPVKKAVAAKSSAVTSAKKSAATTKGNGESFRKLKITPEQRYCMVAEAAYYRAEKRGFVGGDTAHDWVEAEAEISRLIGG